MRRPSSSSSRTLPPSCTPLLAALAALALGLAGCGGDTGREEAAAAPPPVSVQATPGEDAPAGRATTPEAASAPEPATESEPALQPESAEPAAAATPRALEPEAGVPASVAPPEAPDPAPAPRAAPAAAPGQLTVHLRRPATLRTRPNGPVVARLAARTEFDSPRVLPVLRQSGRWLAVISSELPNGRVGWIPAAASMQAHRSDYRVEASLGRREVVVRRGGRVVSRFPVAIGSPGTPTPTGRFAVTDKLLTGDAGSPYGCCILALSGQQTRTPQGWGGGDRLAIHATNLPETIGSAASLGCLRAPAESARRLVQTVPLGTIVTIRA